MSKLGKRLIKSANEALAIARGEMEPARVFTVADVAAIRKGMKLSQEKFAPASAGSLDQKE
jgi:putative transcriptional regulator